MDSGSRATAQDWVLNRLVQNVGRAIRANPVLDKDGVSMGEYRYEGAVANRALELVGKHLGMFTDKPDIFRPRKITDLTDDDLRQIILEGRGGNGAAGTPGRPKKPRKDH